MLFFQKDHQLSKDALISSLFDINGLLLYYKKTPNALQCMVPKAYYPHNPLNHFRAAKVAFAKKIWERSGLTQTLRTFLN
jgi:hypothetical protein